MKHYYLYKDRIFTFSSKLNDKFYKVSTNEEDQYTHYVEVSEERAYEILNPKPIEPIEEDIETIRERLLHDIEYHDKSDNVNVFYVNGKPTWLDKATRVGLMNSTTIAQRAGESAVSFWIGNECLYVYVKDMMDMLDKIELYAMKCFNTTATHKAIVKDCTDREYLLSYNHTTNYPEKIYIML